MLAQGLALQKDKTAHRAQMLAYSPVLVKMLLVTEEMWHYPT